MGYPGYPEEDGFYINRYKGVSLPSSFYASSSHLTEPPVPRIVIVTMVAISTFLSLALAGTGALAAPAADAEGVVALEKRQSTPNSQGTHDGFFYSWWSDGASPATYTNLAGGSYSIEWQSGGNLVGGKGWNPGVRER